MADTREQLARLTEVVVEALRLQMILDERVKRMEDLLDGNHKKN
jgi:hypothetical protein